MGFELRSIQRKFNSLMGEVRPQMKPRFMVWLDERLAEFKIKGTMNLGETLEDPQWIKDYYKSKRESKAAAIKKREDKTNSSSGGASIHPKSEAKSESSNGHAHPDELEGKLHEEKTEASEKEEHVEEKSDEHQELRDQTNEAGFQLVEVKQEQFEDNDDDDMIIVGETLAIQPESSYQTFVNPSRETLTGLGNRTIGNVHRKRQRFGINAPRPLVPYSSRRFKSHLRPTFRSTSTLNIQDNASLKDSSSSLPVFRTATSSYSDDNSHGYTDSDGNAFSQYYSQSESLRLPEHLQTQNPSLHEPYTEGGDDMYADFGDESYDPSYMVESAESSLQYDEEGNAVIQGDQTVDESSMEPLPGTSDESNRQDPGYRLDDGTNFIYPTIDNLTCGVCYRSFTRQSNVIQHIRYYHLKERWNVCPYCDRSFPRKENLEGHINMIHLKIRPFLCRNCGAKFAYKGRLQSHMRYKCSHVCKNI